MDDRKRIYFVQGEKGGPIKVGHSSDPQKRMYNLQVGYPDKLVMLYEQWETNWLTECRVLIFFQCIALQGEWLEPHPLLQHFIFLLKIHHEVPARELINRKHFGSSKDRLYEIEIEYWKTLAIKRGQDMKHLNEIQNLMKDAQDKITKISLNHEMYCFEENDVDIFQMAIFSRDPTFIPVPEKDAS